MQRSTLPTPVNPESPASLKEKLRLTLRGERDRFARGPHFAEANAACCEAVYQAAQQWECFAAFVPTGSEPQILPALERLHAQGKGILLPKLGRGLARSWAWFDGAADLTEQAPKRPPAPSGESMDAGVIAGVDGIFVPALAIDENGTRLGQGGGWYDRVLPLLGPQASVIAVVFAHGLVHQPLPIEDHDIAVDAVITEDGFAQLIQ